MILSIKPASSQNKTKIIAKDTSGQVTVPKEEKSVTHHSILIGNKKINFTATSGTLIIKDSADCAMASIDYFAYTLDDVKSPSARPIAFAYNGGPGSFIFNLASYGCIGAKTG